LGTLTVEYYARKDLMGPTNVALVKLFRVEQGLGAAQGRLESASSSVRILERRIGDLSENLKLAQAQLRERQAKVGELDLDIQTREAKIERFRSQQQNASNHKEYQAFLTEINTEKIDKAKVEDELLRVMEAVEGIQPRIADLSAQVQSEQKRLEETQSQMSSRLAALQSEVDGQKLLRDEVAKAVPPTAMNAFERLAERFDGEAMSAIAKPDRRHEEYLCTACNMSLVADVYNRLHSRDDLVFCPSCQRLLFIPDSLPPETAINKPKERREPREKAGAAAIGRQTSAADVRRSITPEAAEAEEAAAPNGQDQATRTT